MIRIRNLMCGLAFAGLPAIALAQPPQKPKASAVAGKPGYLGIFMNENEEGKSGATVRELPSDSPAGKAGLRVGDNIVEIDGKKIDGPQELAAQVKGKKAGDKLEVKVIRDGREEKVSVALGERPKEMAQTKIVERDNDDAQPQPKRKPEATRRFRIQNPTDGAWRVLPGGEAGKKLLLGVQLQNIDDDLRKRLKLGDAHGVLVAEVIAKSPAEKAGVKAEDVIVEADGKKSEQPTDLTGLIAGKKAGDSIKLKLIRAGKPIELSVTLEAVAAPTGAQAFRFDLNGDNPPSIVIPEGLEQLLTPNGVVRPRQEMKKMEEQIKKLEDHVKRLDEQLKKTQAEIEKLRSK